MGPASIAVHLIDLSVLLFCIVGSVNGNSLGKPLSFVFKTISKPAEAVTRPPTERMSTLPTADKIEENESYTTFSFFWTTEEERNEKSIIESERSNYESLSSAPVPDTTKAASNSKKSTSASQTTTTGEFVITPANDIDELTSYFIWESTESQLEEYVTSKSSSDTTNALNSQVPFRFFTIPAIRTTATTPSTITKNAIATKKLTSTPAISRDSFTLITLIPLPSSLSRPTTKAITTARYETRKTVASKVPTLTLKERQTSLGNRNLISTPEKDQHELKSGSSFIIKSPKHGLNDRHSAENFPLTDNPRRNVQISASITPITVESIKPSLHDPAAFWSEYWHWILIGLVLLIFLFIIPGLFLQIYLTRRCKRRRNKDEKYIKDTSVTDATKTGDSRNSSSSESRSTGSHNSSHLESARKQTSSLPEADVHRLETPGLKSDSSSGENATVIVIEDPRINLPNPNRTGTSSAKDFDCESLANSNYDVKIEIGNEAIIKSTGVTQRAVQPPADHLNLEFESYPKRNTTKPKKAKEGETERLPHDFVAPSSRYRENRDVKRREREHQHVKKDRKRKNRKSALSKSTKSLLETARGLDEVLEAITSLTQQYPIPNIDEKLGKKRFDASLPKSPDRKRKSHKYREGSPRRDSERRRKRKSKRRSDREERRSSKKRTADSRKPHRDKTKKQDKSEAAEKEGVQSEKTIPTLVREELPVRDKVKDERRRRRLEKDLQKLRKFHNNHSKPDEDS